MRKVTVFLLVLLLLFITTACGSRENAPAASETTKTTPDTKDTPTSTPTSTPEKEDKEAKVWNIAVIPKNASSQWGIRLGQGVTKFSEETGHNAFYKGPATVDSAAQIQVIEDMVAQDVDAICLIPLDVAACEPVLKRARDQGIVVITHEASSIQNKDYDLEAFNNNEFGSYCLDLIAEQVGDREGDFIMMVGVFTNGSHNEWADAAEARVLKYPNIHFKERVESGESFEGAYNKATELIKKYPNLIAIQGSSSADVPGICHAIEDAQLSGKIVVGGLGIPSNVKQYVERGILKSFALWDPKNATYAMCKLATMVLEGEKIDNGTNLGPGYESITVNENNVVIGSDMITVTKDNIDQYNF